MNDSIVIFPDYFDKSAIKSIESYGKPRNYSVYRVSKYGKDMTKAFLNYYDEVIAGLKPVRGDKEAVLNGYKKNIDTLSVSCYEKLEDILPYFDVTLKDEYPQRIMLKGTTAPPFGLSQLTSERKPHRKDSHVDWWLYKDATPWTVFSEVKSNE